MNKQTDDVWNGCIGADSSIVREWSVNGTSLALKSLEKLLTGCSNDLLSVALQISSDRSETAEDLNKYLLF